MRLTKFIYSVPLVKDFLVFKGSVNDSNKTYSHLLTNKELSPNIEINNVLLNLWNKKDYLKIASILREDPKLLHKSQEDIIFNHLSNFIFSHNKSNTINAEMSHKDLFGFFTIIKSHPDIEKRFSKNLVEHYIKNAYAEQNDVHSSLSSLLLLAPPNSNYNPPSPYKGIYGHFSNDSDEFFYSHSFLKSPRNFEFILNYVITVMNTFDFEKLYKINEDKTISLVFTEDFYKNYQKKNPDQPEQKIFESISLKSVLAAELSKYLIEHNFNHSNRFTLPVPILVSCAYLTQKHKNGFNIDLKSLEKIEYANKLFKLRAMNKTDEEQVNFYDDSLAREYLNNYELKSKNTSSKNDYFNVLSLLKNRNISNNHLNYEDTVRLLIAEISNTKIKEAVTNTLDRLKRLNDYNENVENQAFLTNLQTTFLKIVENYSSCASTINSQDLENVMISQPLLIINKEIEKFMVNQQEQSMNSFVQTTKKARVSR